MAFLYFSFLKLFVWPWYHVLNVLSVNPMYDLSLLVLCLVTVALYIRIHTWPFSSTGHVSFTWQLQLFIVFFYVAFFDQHCFVVV